MLQAAVVIPFIRHPAPTLVFVRRAAHLRRNPGQIAFPGGLIDAADGPDPVAAALREFEEELGVARERVRIVERLDGVVTLALNVTVVPFLGVLEPPVEFRFDPSETESVHEIPAAALYAPGALHPGTEPVERDGERMLVHTWLFDYGDLHVWGATARMLHALTARYPSLESLPLAPAS
ncbi:MAG: NUDIX hydrolase [Vulcanimicrobiaceae bacterium]